MIKTLYQFGQQLQKMDDMKHYFEVYNSPYSNNEAIEKLVIYIEIWDRQTTGELFLEDYKKINDKNYLYREYAPNGTGILPTLNLYNQVEKKDFDEKVEGFIKKLQKSISARRQLFEKYFDTTELINNVSKQLRSNLFGKLSKKQNYLFTLKINGKYLGEYAEFYQELQANAYNQYFLDSNNKEYKSKDKLCAVTYNLSEEVWGWVDTLGFTLEKESFSRNGFNIYNSYKMFPVSPDAVKTLEGTRRALEDAYSFGFQNLRFFVLPRFIAVNDEAVKKSIARKFTLNCKRKNTPLSIENQSKVLVQSEEIFSEIIEDNELSKNSIYYDIFFYEQKQAQFSIKLHVSDVIPSRFKAIFEAKEKIETYYQAITDIASKNGVSSFHLTFYKLKEYFPEPFFFQIMEAIFYKNPIKEKQVLAVFMDIIITAFKNPSNDLFSINNFHQTIKKTFVIYQYFQKLKLFGDMENNENIPLSIVAQNFVEQHPNFFQNKPLKEAAFYLGCATEILLNAQESYLGNRPFKHKLNNLSIGYKELMLIKPKLIDKTEEYEKAEKLYGDYPEFLQIIAKFDNTFTSGQEKDADKTELSYAFSLGLTIQKEFFEKRKKERSIAKAQRLATEKLKN